MENEAITYWNKKKVKLKKKYPSITDKDMSYCEGEEREMLEILCSKLGKTEQEILNIIVWL